MEVHLGQVMANDAGRLDGPALGRLFAGVTRTLEKAGMHRPEIQSVLIRLRAAIEVRGWLEADMAANRSGAGPDE
jgi:hypothetical protein